MGLTGKLITIEYGVSFNLEGFFLDTITSHFDEKQIPYILTREPGGTQLGEKLREIILNDDMSLLSETLLLFAARAEHIEKVIKPQLEKGVFVISDRFSDTTFAYQVIGKGLHPSIFKALNDMVLKGVEPNLTFFLNQNDELKNKNNRPNSLSDKFQRMDTSFSQRVISGYVRQIKSNPKRFKIINADLERSDLTAEVKVTLDSLLT